MPFTASHPAAVLPLLLHRPIRRQVTPSALMIGAMVPDISMFLPSMVVPWAAFPGLYDHTHGWSGVVTVDLVIGLGLLALWHGAVGPAALAALPPELRLRLRWRPPTLPSEVLGSWPALLRAAVSLIIGAASHLVWDAFTHNGRWGTELLPRLQDTYAGASGAWWLQMVSTAVGALAILAAVAAATGASAPDRSSPDRLDPRPLPSPITAAVWLLVVGAGLATALVVLARSAGTHPELRVVQMLTNGSGVAATLIVVLAVGWRAVVGLADDRSGRPRP